MCVFMLPFKVALYKEISKTRHGEEEKSHMKYPERMASKEELERRKIITSWAQGRKEEAQR